MARGRFVSRSISVSVQVDDLIERCGYEGGLLFTWLIAHLDVEGRISGEAKAIAGTVVPMRRDLSLEKIDQILNTAHDLGLITRYETDGVSCIEAPRFENHQTGLRKDREAGSKLPEKGNKSTTPDLLRSNSGSTPCHNASDPLSSLNLNTKRDYFSKRDLVSKREVISKRDVTPTRWYSEIQEVFQYWKERHPKSPRKALATSSDEYRAIAALMDEGLDVAGCCTVIDGYHNSKFHQGDNDNLSKHLSLSLMFRDWKHAEFGLEQAGMDPEVMMLSKEERRVRLKQALTEQKIAEVKAKRARKELGDGR